MKTENTVFFISKSAHAAELVQSKIMLLRAVDEFVHIGYEKCFEAVKNSRPGVIFYDARDDKEEFFTFLKKIKQSPVLAGSSIIMLYENVDEETLCTAFELGICDFLPINSSDSEFTIRVLWAIQKKEHVVDTMNKTNILCQLKILDKKTKIYTKNYTYTILKEASKHNPGALAVIAPDVNTRNKLAPGLLASIVKKNIRITDILGFSGDFKLYIWFPNTDQKSVLSILDKIKKQLPDECTISGGISHTDTITFEETEAHANKALSEALLREKSFVIHNAAAKEDEKYTCGRKNFKLFKQTFHKKFEKIISPVFYQTQKIIEEKLFETQVKQEIKETESFFNLKNEKCDSLFKITYPGYTKINVDISHDVESKTYANRICLDLSEISGEKISSMLDSFIKDFQSFN